MQQRGQKSAAALAVVSPVKLRVEPPEDMPDDQKAIWAEFVSGKPAEWFDGGSVPVLTEYVRAVWASNALEDRVKHSLWTGDVRDATQWLKLRNVERAAVITAATKLRMTPQSRYTAAKAVTAANREQGAQVWARAVNQSN